MSRVAVRGSAIAAAASAVVVALAVAVASPALARTDRTTKPATLWQDRSLSVSCGLTLAAYSTRDVLCSARGVPRPPHGTPGEGDPFVELAATGRPKLVLVSQDLYPAGARSVTYLAGSLWTARGVTCHIEASTVLCFNASNHGFRIGDGHYRAF